MLILDEPANGLDPQARIEMRQLLLDLAERGKTLIVTSHILPELARICHRVAIITRGRLRAFGTLDGDRRASSASCGRWRCCWPDAGGDRPGGGGRPPARRAGDGGHAVAGRVGRPVPHRRSDEEDWPALLPPWSSAGLGVTQFREVQTDLEEAFMTVARADRARRNGIKRMLESSTGDRDSEPRTLV